MGMGLGGDGRLRVLVVVGRGLSATLVALLLLTWALCFTTSFHPNPQTLTRQDLVYSVLHPLLMVIGFILISGEAILVHRWLGGSRQRKKKAHLWLQGVALGCALLGIWTKFQGTQGVVANFYTLHSWMGLLSVALFGAQWLMGFLSFWHRGEVRMSRMRVLPWHVFVGLYTYGLAVITAETGLLEKLTFLQTNGVVLKRCSEAMIVNGLGLSLAMLCGVVILTAVSPKHHQTIPTTKVVAYSDDTEMMKKKFIKLYLGDDFSLGRKDVSSYLALQVDLMKISNSLFLYL